MHEIAVSHELLALTTDLSLLASNIALGNQRWVGLSEVVAEVFDDCAGLGKDHGGRGSGGFNCDDGRLAEGVDLLQLGWGELVGTALEDLQLVLELEFLQQPEDAVASRLFEPSLG